MKRRKISLIVKFISVVFILARVAGAQWQGKVETVDGIKVIFNPGQPAYGEIEFELKRDLNKRFDIIPNFDVDSEDNIYVIERKSWEARKYSPKGKLMMKFGGIPKQSGEITAVAGGGGWTKVAVDDKAGEIYLKGGGKIFVYDNEGRFLRSVPWPEYLMDFWIGDDGNLWVKYVKSREIVSEKIRDEFCFFGIVPTRGGAVKEISVYPRNSTNIIRRMKDGMVAASSTVWHGYEYDLCVSQQDDGSFICGYSQDYILDVLDKDGDLLYKIKKDDSVKPFTQEERQKILRSQFGQYSKRGRDLIRFPETRPFFDQIITDDKGRIYVKRIPSPLKESENQEVDVFSKEGRYIFKIRLPYDSYIRESPYAYTPHMIKNGYFYSVTTKTDPEESILRRFKIKNWDQIKERIK